MRVCHTLAVLLLLGGCASTRAIEPRLATSATDFSHAETVEISLENFKFSPSEVNLQAGHPYALKIVNAASGGHDLTAPDFFAASMVDAEDASRIADGQVDLEGGETAIVRLVPSAGEYKLACTHFGHSALGMTGKIIVR